MTELRIADVTVGGDHARIDQLDRDATAVIVGVGGEARSGTNGISYVGGGGGLAVSRRYGVAVAAPGSEALAGARSMALAFDGGKASGGDGAVVWAWRAGTAQVAKGGMARSLDGAASGGVNSIVFAERRLASGVVADAATGGVAVVREVGDTTPFAPALARAATGAIAIAFDGHHVSGEIGALLVATYDGKGGRRFATALVDGTQIEAGRAYTVDVHGHFVPA